MAAAVALTFSAAGAGCGESGQQSPQTAVEEYVHLLNARQFGEAYDALSSGSGERQMMTRDEFITDAQRFWGDNPVSFRLSDLRFEDVTIESDTATVVWSGSYAAGFSGSESGGVQADTTVVLEDGMWKVEDLWGPE